MVADWSCIGNCFSFFLQYFFLEILRYFNYLVYLVVNVGNLSLGFVLMV